MTNLLPDDPIVDTPTFDQFWALWPKREAKKEALRAWNKLKPAQRVAAVKAVPTHVEHWRQRGIARAFIPHPATWLNGERWDDELGEIFASTASRQPERRSAPEPAWWTHYTLAEAKGREVGVGAARPGETFEQYRARIFQAVEEQRRFGGDSSRMH
jgi:hypothetical protein